MDDNQQLDDEFYIYEATFINWIKAITYLKQLGYKRTRYKFNPNLILFSKL